MINYQTSWTAGWLPHSQGIRTSNFSVGVLKNLPLGRLEFRVSLEKARRVCKLFATCLWKMTKWCVSSEDLPLQNKACSSVPRLLFSLVQVCIIPCLTQLSSTRTPNLHEALRYLFSLIPCSPAPWLSTWLSFSRLCTSHYRFLLIYGLTPSASLFITLPPPFCDVLSIFQLYSATVSISHGYHSDSE